MNTRRLTIATLLGITLWSVACGSDGHSATSIVCDQTYALCSAAQCLPDPRDTDMGICMCDVYDGKSAGHESCEKRKPFVGEDGAQHIVSTFSFENIELANLECPSGTLWANCVDAPCTTDPTNPSHAFCSCPIALSKAPVVTFGGNCNPATCQNAYWSAGPTSAHNELGRALAVDLPRSADTVIEMCSE